MSKLRVGLIGTGKIAIESHLRALQSIPEVAITALVDTDKVRARELSSQHKLDAKVSDSVDDVLGQMDAAIISTPNFTHHKLAMQCLEGGVNVLVEKPMTTLLDDAQQLCETAASQDRILAAGYFMRFLPTVEKVRQIVEQQAFGKPVRFMYRFGTKGGWSPLSSYTMDREAVGGGSLVVLGTHLLDLLLYWFGYPDSVSLRDDSLGGPEAMASAQLNFNGGSLCGDVLISKTVSLREGCAIEFEQGILLFNSFGQSKIVFRPFNDPSSEYVISDRERQAAPDLFKLQAQDFVSACLNGTVPRVSGQVGLDNVRLLHALYASRQPFDEDWYTPASALMEKSA